MENRPSVASEEEDIPDSFTCCICLDLLYKPVVLACGHMACFWCVHHSMSFRDQSRCPICRNPYRHFPAICVTLHFFLLKLYPLASIRRQGQVLEDEKGKGLFSPQFGSNLSIIDANTQYDPTKDLAHASSSVSTASGGNKESPTSAVQLKASSTGNDQSVSTDDVHCAACYQLLFLPVVLNCGHAFCECCIVRPANGPIRCQVCQSLHPGGTLKVCLEFDRFLAERFPEEYKSRRQAAETALVMIESSTSGLGGSSEEGLTPLLTEEHLSSKTHKGVGCDSCGMYPIIGDRYRCINCVEDIGFDLCGECYNSRSKLPGRFNQQHTEEHKFEHVVLRPRGLMMMIDAHVIRQLRGNNYGNESSSDAPTDSQEQHADTNNVSSSEEEDDDEDNEHESRLIV
ncbi:E3 ubiquitin-protein ligase PRT1 [Linum perenne]